MPGSLYIAVDLGAGSGRVFLAGADTGELLFEEIHRFRYPPREKNGRSRWDLDEIYGNILIGIRRSLKRAGELSRYIESIGIDSWAVDYGLVDNDGYLMDDPVCYRDRRTVGAMEKVFDIVPRSEIFERTGIQFLELNTLYQAFCDPRQFTGAGHLLLLPDLINFKLTGTVSAEFTNASTTQLLNARSGDWDRELMRKLGLPDDIFPPVVAAGTALGFVKVETDDNPLTGDLKLIAVASHDTASAVAAAPLAAGSAYISSGTWSLVGVELGSPLINAAVESLNFTNEGGFGGSTRFLKNIAGLWLLESCRREWSERGIDTDHETLVSAAFTDDEPPVLIYPDDPRFANPESMLAAIAEQIAETGQAFDGSPAQFARCIFDSLAFRYASVLRTIEGLTGKAIERVEILGGGGRNAYLDQMTADVSGKICRAGLFEATVLGNVLVQAIAAGRFTGLGEARAYVEKNFDLTEYRPDPAGRLLPYAEQYAEIESRYLKLK